MNDGMRLTPELASAISSRLLRADPDFRKLFSPETVTLRGDQLESLLHAAFLIGAGEGLGIALGKGQNDDLSAALERLRETG